MSNAAEAPNSHHSRHTHARTQEGATPSSAGSPAALDRRKPSVVSGDSSRRIVDGLLALVRSDGSVGVGLRVLVPAAAASKLIGRGGAVHVELQNLSESRIQLSKPYELYPGTADRTLHVGGALRSCLTALHLAYLRLGDVDFTKEALSEADMRDASRQLVSDSVRLVLPSSVCGKIIGQRGDTIRSTAQQSGSNLSFNQSPDPDLIPERVLTISGSLLSALKAMALVVTQVATSLAPTHGRSSAQPTPRASSQFLHVPDDLSAAELDSAGYDWWPAGPYAAAMYPPLYDQLQRSIALGPSQQPHMMQQQAAASLYAAPSSSLTAASAATAAVAPAYYVTPAMPHTLISTPLGVPYSASARPALPSQQLAAGRGVMAYWQPAAAVAPYAPDNSLLMPEARPPSFSVNLDVPDSRISSLIGSRMEWHGWTQRMLGVQVHIGPLTRQPGEMRRVTITGSQERVEHAVRFIQERPRATRQASAGAGSR